MDDETVQRIRRSAQVAYMDVWESAVIPAGVHSGGLQFGMEAVEDRSEAAYRETVIAMCAEFGADERDYYRADPDAAERYEPACMAEEPDYPGEHDACADEDRMMDDQLRSEDDDFGQSLGY
ncbi:hypothetical protein DMP23_21355 [Amycolatopsis sp. A1MSW2902]|uniref:hypothetical protein n=1 Tax=Amycolatopsis sp. A1MSW2902 TaxID=687413 RepID=UPI00307E17B9